MGTSCLGGQLVECRVQQAGRHHCTAGTLSPSAHPPRRKRWFRVPTSYDETSGVLSWTHTPAHGSVYYSYFAPYRCIR